MSKPTFRFAPNRHFPMLKIKASNDGVPDMKPVTTLNPLFTRLVQMTAAAAILGVSPVTVRRRVRDGSLPHIRIKGRLYFKPTELQAFIEAHRGGLVF
jgi:excisionase family DNA binding protein